MALTWACERFQSYLVGMDFLIQTDHQPLISLLGSRALDDLPPHTLRFRLRLLRFTYNVEHVPVISAYNTGQAAGRRGVCFHQPRCATVAGIRKQARTNQTGTGNSICSKLKYFVQTGWPSSMCIGSSTRTCFLQMDS